MPSQLRASQSLGNPLGSPGPALGQLFWAGSGPVGERFWANPAPDRPSLFAWRRVALSSPPKQDGTAAVAPRWSRLSPRRIRARAS